MRIVRCAVSLAAVAVLLMTLGPVPAAARGGGSPLQSDAGPQPAPVPWGYFGWVEIDVQRSWSVPPSPPLLAQEQHMFIRRFRTGLYLHMGSGSNPPSSVSIPQSSPQFYLMFLQRIQRDPDNDQLCLGSIVVFRGEATFAGYSGAASGSRAVWRIPGMGFTVPSSPPSITFLGGNCEPGRRPLQDSSLAALQAEMAMPGDVHWEFTEGIRIPPSSRTPTSIEGSCDAPVYLQALGRIQCQWKVDAVWQGPPRLVPPRRR